MKRNLWIALAMSFIIVASSIGIARISNYNPVYSDPFNRLDVSNYLFAIYNIIQNCDQQGYRDCWTSSFTFGQATATATLRLTADGNLDIEKTCFFSDGSTSSCFSDYKTIWKCAGTKMYYSVAEISCNGIGCSGSERPLIGKETLGARSNVPAQQFTCWSKTTASNGDWSWTYSKISFASANAVLVTCHGDLACESSAELNCNSLSKSCTARVAATTTIPQLTTTPTTIVVCPQDIQQCPGGTTVSRNPNDNCNFYSCPIVSTTTPIKQCADIDLQCGGECPACPTDETDDPDDGSILAIAGIGLVVLLVLIFVVILLVTRKK